MPKFVVVEMDTEDNDLLMVYGPHATFEEALARTRRLAREYVKALSEGGGADGEPVVYDEGSGWTAIDGDNLLWEVKELKP